jgi:hypothetical protein
MLGALLSFTKLCANPALGSAIVTHLPKPAARPTTATIVQSTESLLNTWFQSNMPIVQPKLAYCNFFLSRRRRYGNVPSLAVIVTSCHSSAKLSSAVTIFYCRDNNFTTSLLQNTQNKDNGVMNFRVMIGRGG